jgi:hypothetical protein
VGSLDPSSVKLKDLAEVFGGVITTKANLHPTSGEPYWIVQGHDLASGEIAPRRMLRRVYLPHVEPTLAIRVDDILVTLATARPSVIVVKEGRSWCIPDVHVAVVRAGSEHVRAEIVRYLTSAEGQTRLAFLQRGELVRHLLAEDLLELEIPCAGEAAIGLGD